MKLKNQKNRESSDIEYEKVSVRTITSQVRLSVKKWIKAQKESKLRSLCEGEHFSIVVARVVKNQERFSVEIRCKCCICLKM